MIAHRDLARRRHAEQYLRRLHRIAEVSGGRGRVDIGLLDEFDRLWPQIRHAHAWAAADSGRDAAIDDLCADYPMAALQYWPLRVSAAERIAILTAALAAAKRRHRHGVAGALDNHLGGAYLDAANPVKAVGRFEEALRISEAHEDKIAQGQDCAGLARAYLELGWTQRAVERLQQAAELCRSVDDWHGVALMERRLADAYHQLGDAAAADAAARRSAEIVAAHAPEGGWLFDEQLRQLSVDGRLKAVSDGARWLLEQGRPDEALAAARAGMAEAGGGENLAAELALLETAVEAAVALGDAREALDLAERRLRRADGTDAERHWEAALHLGAVYQAVGEPARALDQHLDALNLAARISLYPAATNPIDVPPGDEGDWFWGAARALEALCETYAAIAEDHVALGDDAAAVAAYEEAVTRIGRQKNTARHASLLGRMAYACIGAGRYEQAVDRLEERIALHRALGDRAGEADAVGEIGNVRLLEHRDEDAVEKFQAAGVIDLQIEATGDLMAVLANLAESELRLGRARRAAGYARRSLDLARTAGTPAAVAYVDDLLARVTATTPEPVSTDNEDLRHAVRLRDAGDPYAALAVLDEIVRTGADRQTLAVAHLLAGDLGASLRNATTARTGWEQAVTSGDPEIAAIAAEKLAWLLVQLGDRSAASWTPIMNAGDAAVAARAAHEAGVAHLDAGEPVRARPDLEKAIVLGGDRMRHAGYHLGFALARLDDLIGAREAFRYAAGSDQTAIRVRARLQLALVLHDQGDRGAALEAYERVLDDDPPPDVLAAAALGIGQIRELTDDLDDAAAAFERAMSTGDPDVGPAAAAGLGLVRIRQGNHAGALDVLEHALTAGDGAVAAHAAMNLGLALQQLGREDEAERLWESHTGQGNPEVASALAFQLAALRLRRGDRAGAAAVWLARAGGDQRQAAQAILDFGVLVARNSAVDLADGVWAQSALFDVPDLRRNALLARVVVLERDRPQRAEDLLRSVIESADPDLAPAAAMQLGHLMVRQKNPAGAAAAFAAAADTGHPDYVAHALYELGVLRGEDDDLAGARVFYERVLALPPAEITPSAAVNLSGVAWRLGDLAAAEEALRIALQSDDAAQVAKAWINLGVLREQRGDHEGAREAWRTAVTVDPAASKQARTYLHLPPGTFFPGASI